MEKIQGAGRAFTQIREHYEIEKELAAELRRASRDERRLLYSELYDQLYRRVPHHPMLSRKASREERSRAVAEEMRFLSRYLGPDSVFLEIGAGDCALSLEVAKHVRQVYAVDVSDEITKGIAAPANFRLVISDGCSVGLPPETAHVAYSNQLMEHLHPDDAREQLRCIYDALAPGGVYVCRTPNRLNGPHDISRFFDRVATGFHLKEYTVGELSDLFGQVGFSRLRLTVATRGRYLPSSIRATVVLEKLLVRLGAPPLRSDVLRRLLRPLLGIWISGFK